MPIAFEDITSVNILDAAIDRLHRVGWLQDDSGEVEGPNCITGAMWFGVVDLTENVDIHFISPNFLTSPVYAEALDAIAQVLATGTNWVTVWNDDPQRTVEDVFLALKEARTNLEAAE